VRTCADESVCERANAQALTLRCAARSDCTHYCYTPQFWKAFFSGVFEAHEAIGAAPAV
jgi:hypothetical protein